MVDRFNDVKQKFLDCRHLSVPVPAGNVLLCLISFLGSAQQQAVVSEYAVGLTRSDAGKAGTKRSECCQYGSAQAHPKPRLAVNDEQPTANGDALATLKVEIIR